MDLSFSFSTLFAGFAFGVFGVFLIRAAKREARVEYALIGITLLVFPYFVENPWLLWGLGLALLLLAYRLGRY